MGRWECNFHTHGGRGRQAPSSGKVRSHRDFNVMRTDYAIFPSQEAVFLGSEAFGPVGFASWSCRQPSAHKMAFGKVFKAALTSVANA